MRATKLKTDSKLTEEKSKYVKVSVHLTLVTWGDKFHYL